MLLLPVMLIRVLIRMLIRRQLLLGNKYCETLDLFCAQPQMMTVNLNASGSVKLNLVVTWESVHSTFYSFITLRC